VGRRTHVLSDSTCAYSTVGDGRGRCPSPGLQRRRSTSGESGRRSAASPEACGNYWGKLARRMPMCSLDQGTPHADSFPAKRHPVSAPESGTGVIETGSEGRGDDHSVLPNYTAKPKADKKTYFGDQINDIKDISSISLRRPVDRVSACRCVPCNLSSRYARRCTGSLRRRCASSQQQWVRLSARRLARG
jgi:hypothetical protein